MVLRLTKTAHPSPTKILTATSNNLEQQLQKFEPQGTLSGLGERIEFSMIESHGWEGKERKGNLSQGPLLSPPLSFLTSEIKLATLLPDPAAVPETQRPGGANSVAVCS